MIRNYLTIAVRNLLKHKSFSFINISGLSVGIACCVLLALFIKDEFDYEQHFDDHQRIYRIYSSFISDTNEQTFPRTSPPVAMAIAEQFPEIEMATRVVNPPEVEQHVIRYMDKTYFEKAGLLVDSTFFDLFSYSFKEGDRFTALDGPSSVVISAEVAMKIFGENSPLDELIIINSGQASDTFRITGVLNSFDKPSHLNANFYMCMNSQGWGQYVSSVTTWAWQNFVVSYVKLKPLMVPSTVEEKIPQLIEQHSGEELKNAGVIKEMHLQPLDDIRLFSSFNNTYGMGEQGSIQYVYILASIGLFILLLACINFMNLTTAKASQRAGEVGVRKSLGATRKNLIGQFLGESMAIVFAAVIFALVLVQLVLPLFNTLTQKELSLNSENITYLVTAILVIGIATGILAGSYPAFFLSAFQPARVLKDKRLSGGSSNVLRKTLVAAQFVITITLISSILVIQQQLDYIQSKSLGFEPEQKIMIPLQTNDAKTAYTQLHNAFIQITGVENVSGTTSLPSTLMLRDFSLYPQGSSMDKAILHRNALIDEKYFSLLDIKLKAGRDLIFEVDSFSWENTHRRIIVNETSLKELNITLEDAIGTRLLTEWEGQVFTHEVVGVVEDFHQFSMHQKITPLLFYVPSNRGNFAFLVASLKGGEYETIITQMETKWKELVPTTPFESQFLSDSVQKQYEADRRVSAIISVFTMLAIAISCLGLYGLSVYIAERRVKEIGIRKVLGASVSRIIIMLSVDFIKLVAIAFLIAIPVGYFAMEKWLEGFAYKINLNVMVFLGAGILSIAIAWLTIGFESVKAAISNPVDSLRNE